MVIDCHTHVNWIGRTADDLVHHMDAIGVDKAWVLSWQAVDGGLESNYHHLSPESAMAAGKAHPDRLIPFCAVDPRRECADEMLRRFVDAGCRGYGELKVRLMYDNPDCLRMFRLCAELGIPVLVHIDVPLPRTPMWYGGNIDALERAVLACPRTCFIGHGPGFWREISANASRSKNPYPTGDVVPGGKLPAMLAKYKNLYADLSAGSGLNALKRDVSHARNFLDQFHRKLLYGTDIFTRDHLDFLEELALPRKVFDAITGRNAARLVPID